MSIELAVPYISADEFKDVADIRDVDDDTLIQTALAEAATQIDQYCNRTFHVVTEQRTFHAPHSEWLLIGDCQEVTEVRWFGNVLPVEEYALLRGMGDYDQLLRYYGGPVPGIYCWDVDPVTGLPLGLPWSKILVTGTWGYRASYDLGVWVEQIPAKVARANTILALRLWQMRTTHYTGEGGGVQIGRTPAIPPLMSQEVKDLLNPYMRSPLPLIIGSPYGD